MEQTELTSFVQRILREHEKDDGLIISKLKEKEGCVQGDGFMSRVLSVEVFGMCGSGKPYSNKIFIKKQPSSAARVELFNLNPLFNNEAILYSEILPLLPEGCDSIPRCFYADKDCIVLENLHDQGYKMADKLKGLDLKHSELAIKAIAGLHASTYALNVRNETKFSEIISKTLNVLKDSSTLDQILESSLVRGIQHLIETKDETITKAIPKLELFKGKMSSTLLKIQTSDVTVLGHGDFWINNMMFRYKDGSVEDIKIIDFQAISLTSPAADVWKFLYTSLSPDTLNNICDRLISIYCTHFTENIEKLKLPKNKVISYDILQKEILSKELYGLLVAIMYLPALYSDFANESVDLDDFFSNPEFMKEAENLIIPGYGERLAALVKRCQLRGII